MPRKTPKNVEDKIKAFKDKDQGFDKAEIADFFYDELHHTFVFDLALDEGVNVAALSSAELKRLYQDRITTEFGLDKNSKSSDLGKALYAHGTVAAKNKIKKP